MGLPVAGEIIIGANELQGLAIISGEDKEKQKRQARNIDMKKRNSLSLLLKTLHRIGMCNTLYI